MFWCLGLGSLILNDLHQDSLETIIVTLETLLSKVKNMAVFFVIFHFAYCTHIWCCVFSGGPKYLNTIWRLTSQFHVSHTFFFITFTSVFDFLLLLVSICLTTVYHSILHYNSCWHFHAPFWTHNCLLD